MYCLKLIFDEELIDMLLVLHFHLLLQLSD